MRAKLQYTLITSLRSAFMRSVRGLSTAPLGGGFCRSLHKTKRRIKFERRKDKRKARNDDYLPESSEPFGKVATAGVRQVKLTLLAEIR